MKNQDRKDRRYKMIYEDKQGNELFFLYRWYPNLKYAKSIAKKVIAENMLNDVVRIRVVTAFL